MRRPAWLAVGAAAGGLAIAAVGTAAVLLAGLALLALATAAHLARHGRAAALAALACGILAIGLRGAAAGGHPLVAGPLPQGKGPWIGIVQSVAGPRAGARPAVVALDREPPLIIAATLPWYPPVVPGDRVELGGAIRLPPEGEYGAYLRRIGVAGAIYADSLEVLPDNATVPRALEGLRRLAADGLDHTIPEPEAGLAAGVLIGLRDRVDRDLATAFTTAGASHVVAISGWNIAIVASTLAALAGGIRRRRRAILTAVAIAAYVVFVGPSPSVVRAAAMAGVALLARELGRPGTAIAALGWAVTALLLVDPAWVDDAGFRLSVLATAGIIAWGAPLTSRLAGEYPGRPRRWLAEILGVSLAAQAATTPIVLLEFGRLSLVAPVVNLVVVPLVPAAMAAGVAAMAVGVLVEFGVPAILGVVAGLPAWVLYAAMVATVRVGAALPLASLELEPPWDAVAGVASVVLIVLGVRHGDRILRRIRRRRRPAGSRVTKPGHRPGGHERATRLAAGVLVSACLGLALVVAHRPGGAAKVTVLDVGQGDGILVEGGQGGRMVVDGGPDPGRLIVALDERLPPWDRRVDVLVLTHPHEDHVAGLALLLERYRVARVYEPGMIGPGPGYEAWAGALAGTGIPHFRLATGDRLRVDGITLRVLWPDPGRVPERPRDGGTAINNVSIVLLGEVAGHRFLLAGDIEEGVDPELLARGLPTVDLLKVAHHGSRTASTAPFLAAVHPRIAVVSAGTGNPYGHPAPSTIERLRAVARETYRTDTDGTVEITFDGDAIRVHASGPRPSTSSPGSMGPGAAPSVSRAVAVVAPSSRPAGGLRSFLCGIAPAIPGQASSQLIEPPTAPESLPIREALAAADANNGLPSHILPRPPREEGRATAFGYHRPHADLAGIGDGLAPRQRSPRLLLGRRRVRARGRAGRVPERHEPLSGRAAGSVATRGGAQRPRPPPR